MTFKEWLNKVARLVRSTREKLYCLDAELAYAVGDTPEHYGHELATIDEVIP